MKEAARASQRVGTTLWQGQRGKEVTPAPLSLPSLCKMYMPSLPSQYTLCPWCWRLLWDRTIGCAGPEHRSTSTQSEGHVFLCDPWQHEHTTWSHNLLHSEF